jgi:molybdopterin/thiamine biosynthesis adenylyltransferase
LVSGAAVNDADVVVNTGNSCDARRRLDSHCIEHRKPSLVLATSGSQGDIFSFVLCSSTGTGTVCLYGNGISVPVQCKPVLQILKAITERGTKF